MLINNGQPIDGLVGGQTERDVRQMLDKYLPKPWEKAFQQAQLLLESQSFSEALILLRQVYEASEKKPEIAVFLTHTLVELQRLEEAESLLSNVKAGDQTPHYEQVVALLTVKKQVAKSPGVVALEEALKQDPENLDITYKLALQLQQEGCFRPALDLLLGILRKNRNFSEGGAKKTIMDILAILGKSDPLAIEYQRKLFTLLY
jgi:putative thioredoxin